VFINFKPVNQIKSNLFASEKNVMRGFRSFPRARAKEFRIIVYIETISFKRIENHNGRFLNEGGYGTFMVFLIFKRMSVLLIDGPKCTLAASDAAPW